MQKTMKSVSANAFQWIIPQAPLFPPNSIIEKASILQEGLRHQRSFLSAKGECGQGAGQQALWDGIAAGDGKMDGVPLGQVFSSNDSDGHPKKDSERILWTKGEWTITRALMGMAIRLEWTLAQMSRPGGGTDKRALPFWGVL